MKAQPPCVSPVPAQAFGEVPILPLQPALKVVEFQLVVVLGGLLGLGISFTSLWWVAEWVPAGGGVRWQWKWFLAVIAAAKQQLLLFQPCPSISGA